MFSTIKNRISSRKATYNATTTYYSEPVIYPVKETIGFPIITNNHRELIYLYFPEEELQFLKKALRSVSSYVYRETDIQKQLNEFILKYLKKMFITHRLDERIAISYDEEMSQKICYFSLVIEMTEKFKAKPTIADKLKNFRKLKNDMLKNINQQEIGALSYDPFSLLKNTTPNAKLLPKWGLSFKDETKELEMYESDDDEELRNLRKMNQKSKSKKGNKKSDFSYKDIIKNIFVKKLSNDFRGNIVEYCLDNNPDFKDDHFEWFVCYIEFFVLLFGGINVKYYIDELGYLDLDFYASEKIFMNIAETMHYQVQFRIFGKSFIVKANEKSESIETKSSLKMKRNEMHQINNIQYEDCDINSVDLFPPFTNFIKALADRFRRYDSFDNYHLCSECDRVSSYQETYSLSCSSVFRHIDKSRLISGMLNYIVDLGYINKMLKRPKNSISKVFKAILIIQNEKLQKSMRPKDIVLSLISPIKTTKVRAITKKFRNLYGEQVGFYYTWITHYIKWLMFPSIIGVLFHFFYWFFALVKLHSLDLFLSLFFTALVVLWGHYYVFSWNSLQDVYEYIWGMTMYKLENFNVLDDNFAKIDYINHLGIKIPIVNRTEYIVRSIISFIIIVLSTFVMICVNLLIFYIQRAKLYENADSPIANKLQKIHRGYGLYIVPILIFFVREIMSKIYKKISKWLTKIEKPIDIQSYNESVIKKQLVFEFFNYYFNLYYIAFCKKYFEFCQFGDCYLELGNQLIMILLSDMVSLMTKLFYKGIYLRNKIKKFENKILEKYINSNNTSKKYIYYTRSEFDEGDVQNLLLPIVFNFGYVLQFGACCPLSFVFMLGLTVCIRMANSLSMGHLLYVKVMSDSKGIGVYNRMQGFISFMGLFTNLFIIFYTNNNFVPLVTGKKLLYFVIVENFVFLVLKLGYIDQKPFWFDFRSGVEVRYLQRYGLRQKNVREKFKHRK